MGWKQTLILGGAVLLLAACDRATAPVVNVRDGGAAARDFTFTSTDSTSAPADSANSLSLNDCRNGLSINSGRTEDCTDQ